MTARRPDLSDPVWCRAVTVHSIICSCPWAGNCRGIDPDRKGRSSCGFYRIAKHVAKDTL